MTHICPKPEKYLFPGISGCILSHVQGVPVNPHVQRVQNMYGKGGWGVKNAWLWAAFDLSFSCSGRLIESCPKPGIFDSLPPLCHTYSEPSGHKDSPGPPVPGVKMHPEMPGNKYFSSFGQLWVIQSPFRLKRV